VRERPRAGLDRAAQVDAVRTAAVADTISGPRATHRSILMNLRGTSQDTCFITRVLCLILLCTVAGVPVARADESTKAAKIAELMQLTSARQFLRSVDGNFDQEDAARAWGRFYADNLTESDLDAILAYYRSPVGQKDVGASRAALAQVQHYMVEKRRAGAATAVAGNAAAATTAVANNTTTPATATGAPGVATGTAGGVTPGAGTAGAVTPGAAAATATPRAPATDAATTSSAVTPDVVPVHPWDSNPLAPNGRVVSNTSAPERCEAPPPAAPGVHAVPPSGRSVVCVCTDEKGALTRDPMIVESSGDSRVDSGALKMARADSGRYIPPTLGGRPQSACFRLAIDFRRHP
jgi:hypothetical protein